MIDKKISRWLVGFLYCFFICGCYASVSSSLQNGIARGLSLLKLVTISQKEMGLLLPKDMRKQELWSGLSSMQYYVQGKHSFRLSSLQENILYAEFKRQGVLPQAVPYIVYLQASHISNRRRKSIFTRSKDSYLVSDYTTDIATMVHQCKKLAIAATQSSQSRDRSSVGKPYVPIWELPPLGVVDIISNSVDCAIRQQIAVDVLCLPCAKSHVDRRCKQIPVHQPGQVRQGYIFADPQNIKYHRVFDSYPQRKQRVCFKRLGGKLCCDMSVAQAQEVYHWE